MDTSSTPTAMTSPPPASATSPAPDPTRISFKLPRPSSSRHHGTAQTTSDGGIASPSPTSPSQSSPPQHTMTAPFLPDFSALDAIPELSRLVLDKFSTTGGMDLSSLQTLEHSLVADMTALYDQCCQQTSLKASGTAGDMDVDVAVADARASVASVGLNSAGSPAPDHLRYGAPDFSLQIGSTRFPCHRMILYARWPHFAQRVRSGLFASNVWVLSENPLTVEIVGGLLRYLYTNEVEQLPLTDSFCLGLLRAAVLYDLVTPGDLSNQPVKGFELLIAYCRHHLMQPLTIQNCAVILNTLHEHGSITQQNRVISYISRNLKQVMESQEAAKALATVPPQLHSKILFSHFSMLQVLEDQE